MCDHKTLIVSKLNNNGVRLLEKGDFETATTVLCEALKEAKHLLATLAEESKKDHHSTRFRPPHNDCSRAIQISEVNMMPDGCSLYRIAYKLNEASCDLSLFTPATAERTPTPALVCVYNLALSHQLWALESRSRIDILLRSIRLYELAYTMIMQEDSFVDGYERVSLAIVNNLGLAHHAMKNEPKAKQCYDHLLSLLMYYQDSRSVDMGDDLARPILSTVSRQILKAPITPPAA